MILIAIGANLPGPDGAPPLATCEAAVRALSELPGLRLDAVSRWYETEPVPPSGQPNYVNGVARLTHTAAVDPAELLSMLQAIEARFGRRRAEVNAARTLDLDLIDMDGLVRNAPDPILPHPRAHLRAFVLLPLLDVAPDWMHPVTGQTGRALLAEVGQEGVRMMDATAGRQRIPRQSPGVDRPANEPAQPLPPRDDHLDFEVKDHDNQQQE
jgi:2-amino-4-hydroxy-6-hydroxymethyldihydropteridine diphosphokinase